MIGTFRIGADASIALDVVSGDASIVTSVAAWMRRLTANSESYIGEPIALTIAPRAASGSFPVGWNITIPAEMTSDLRSGMYSIDVTLEGAGFTQITETSATIEFTESAVP